MDKSNLAVFWDFDSCPIPAGHKGSTVVDNIKGLLSNYGYLNKFNLYTDESPSSASEKLLGELEGCGISVIAHATEGDSMPSVKLLADLLVYVMDYQHEPDTVIMLISSNPRHAYPLSMLHRRSFSIILVTPKQHQNSQSLQLQASYVYDWALDVLKLPGTTPSPDNVATAITSQSMLGDGDGNELDEYLVVFKPLISALQALQAEGDYQPLRSVVGARLQKNIYLQAGVDSFGHYAALAAGQGIVEVGGQGRTSWISLSK